MTHDQADKPVIAEKRNVHTTNWSDQFYGADNLFPLVKRAAAASLYDNDGRAAYFVAQSLSACASASRQAQRDPDFESKFDSDYANLAQGAGVGESKGQTRV
jgi:hypothetical protein